MHTVKIVNTNIHNFFADNLNLYGTNMPIISKELKTIAIVSKDISMNFGGDKCSYFPIEKGTTVKSGPTDTNQLKMQPIDERYCYRYRGIDENISYNGMLNKEKVTKEYLNRVRKFWSS